jgi:hypothetical protein
MIGLVSLVSIVMYRPAKNAPDKPSPDLLAANETQPIAETEKASSPNELSGKFQVVPATALDSAVDDAAANGNRNPVRPASGEFVEQTPGVAAAGNFHSLRYGYTVSLGGTRWTRWDDLAAVAPQAEWGALLKNYGRFLVMPVLLADAETSPDTVDRTLLAQFGFQYPNQRSTDLETFQRWGSEAHVFRISREISGRENVYRIWILRRDRNAYLVAAWIDRAAAIGAWAAGQNTTATSSNPAINGTQEDAEIDVQLEAVLSRFKLDDLTAAGAQSVFGDRHFPHLPGRLHLLQTASEH